LDNEESGKKRECREKAIDDQENRGEWVYANIKVSKALEDFETPSGQKGIVSGKENLNRASGPTKHLVETVSKVNRS
jgi:hypothetical protein